MKKYTKDLVIFALALIGLLFYGYKHIDWNPPKKKAIRSVQIGGKQIFLSQVKAVQIPQAVYDSMNDNPRWKEYLLGNQKRVLLFTWNGCPYARAFRREFEKALTTPAVSNRYLIDIVETNGSAGGTCTDENCPLFWLLKHCFRGFCIINPVTKEVIEDHSKNEFQILPLLLVYASWNNTPLFAEN